jgi:polyhydroxyalkanoate synthesis regulator phasin
MAQSELLRRYLDAGIQFSQMTQQRAEALVRDLVRAGEVQAEQTQTLVNELVERSRRNTERLVDQIRAEVHRQVDAAEAARKDVATRMQSQIDELRRQIATATRRPASKAAAKKAPAKKSAGKKAAAKKSTKKAAAKKKASAKKSAAAKKTVSFDDVP